MTTYAQSGLANKALLVPERDRERESNPGKGLMMPTVSDSGREHSAISTLAVAQSCSSSSAAR